MNALRERWEAWTQRERRMVVAMSAVVVLALVYLVLVDPALEAHKRYEKELPKLRADASEMAGIASVASRLPKPIATSGDLRGVVDSSLQAAGLKAAVSASPSGSVTVKFEKVGYLAAANWLYRLARDAGVRVDSASVTSAGEGGRINAEYTLAR